MRQKYDNPAPLTMNMALDFNLLEALNDEDYLPKTLAINKPKKINALPHKKNSPKHQAKSNNPRHQGQAQKPHQIPSFKKSQLTFSHQIFKPGNQEHSSNRKLNIRTLKKRSTTEAKKIKQKYIKEYISSHEVPHNKSENRMGRTLSLAQTLSNFNGSNHRFDNTISSLSRQNFNITKHLQMENNRALMVNIRKNLLMSNLSANQEQQIQSVYRVITQKLSQNMEKPANKPAQSPESVKKSNQYIKNINKVDVLEPNAHNPIHNRHK